jgi:protein-tyrosine phosphatase
MKSEVYWIEGEWPGRVAIIPRPRGGDWLEDEAQAWREGGLDVIVSLLTSDEATGLELVSEAELSRNAGLVFISFPITDRSIPASRAATLDLLRDLVRLLSRGKNVGIHCRQGIGRSAVIAAGLLVLSGLPPEHAIEKVSAARRCPVPETAEQREWIVSLQREAARPTVSTP